MDAFRPLAVRASIGSIMLSTTASLVLTVALGLQVYDITRNKLDLGWLGLAEFLPTALLALVSGALADRFDRRWIVAAGGLLEVGVVAGLLLYSRVENPKVTPIFLGVVGFGVARALSGPSMRALVPAAVKEARDIPRVVGLSSAAWQIGSIIGPIIGAFAYKASSTLAYAVALALFAVSSPLVFLVPKAVGVQHIGADGPAKATLRHALEGLVVIRRSPILLGAISLDLFAVLFGGAVALLPAIADERNWDKGSVGTLRAVGGIGGALVTFILAARPLRRNVGRSLLLAVSVFGVATVVFGMTHSLLVAALAIFTLNAGDSVSVFVRSTLVPIVTPPEQQGRVLAVENVFVGASNELGAFESGVAARLLGTTPAVVGGGIATLAIVFIWWFAFPALRNVDRFSDVLGRTRHPDSPGH